jgi:predicted transcriptional regulator
MANTSHEYSQAIADKVTHLSTLGTPIEEIADFLGMNKNTLQKHYKKELVHGRTEVKTEVVGHALSLIRAGDSAMTRFWLERNCGMTEKKEVKLTAENATMLILGKVFEAIPSEFHERVKIAALTALNEAAAAEAMSALAQSSIEAEFEDA